MRSVDPRINEIVRDAVEEFSKPGVASGKADLSIQFAIMGYNDKYPDSPEISEVEKKEIRHRFNQKTTNPPVISDDDIDKNSHSDNKIDGSWFDQLDDDAFTKWGSIVKNWRHGHKSSRLPPKAVESVDKYTSHILGHSFDPSGGPYLWKGLVIGNVQSGKTATYTGLIGKAIDVGYRIIVVMSGRLNTLRYQTESRIHHQVIGFKNDEKSIPYDENINTLTKLQMDGDFDQPQARIPRPRIIASEMRGGSVCLIAVMKKHYSPLEKFADWSDEVSDYYPGFRDLPILLIDDEMDEAGPNTGGEETEPSEEAQTEDRSVDSEGEMIDAPTTTNQAITNLLREERFTRRMYLGLTATPYAIILHKRRKQGSPEFKEYGPDIFPDNYLLVLDDPPSYCGGDVFLGRHEVVVRELSKNESGGLDFGEEILHLPAFEGVLGIYNEVDISEIDRLVPHDSEIPGDRDDWCDYEHAVMTDSLENAIDDFIISGAARAQRGDEAKPCTMMVNVSHRAPVHFDVKRCIVDHLKDLSLLLSTPLRTEYLKRLRERWDSSFKAVVAAFNGMGDEGPEDLVLLGGGDSTDKPTRKLAEASGAEGARPQRTTSFDDISPYIGNFIKEIANPSNNRVLNYHSDDIVDFDEEPGLKAIIYGGYNLGRGLTFKGVVSSYLLRAHSDMSGLMQMQRWCGYRGEEGGERILDLMKIHTPASYRHLLQRMLTIEKKNRYMLGAYVRDNKTPDEFRAVMEQDPDTPLMSAAKRGALKEIGDILAGSTRTQRTFNFTQEEDEDLERNQECMKTFLVGISGYRFHQHSGGGYVYRDVPTKFIEDLLMDWRSVETSGFSCFEVAQWIKRLGDWNESQKTNPLITDDELTHWTVYLPSRANPSTAGDFVAGFDPDCPIELAGKKIVPYSYTLETESRLKTIHSPSFTNIDEKFFHGGARPSSHGLILISPIIHPLNRKSPGGVVALPNPSISGGDPDLHKAGDWPHLISLGFWFPSTTAINTKLVEHGGS